ncbi:MAG: ABC transporter substrate-binding protein [Armatimonadota bacterium]|nr:ABC transporter substrate-binding protein [Armatimonadota bacterium]MDR7452496.1 ABC transporter substrate-binding protein [Armatimonadota bacterium]
MRRRTAQALLVGLGAVLLVLGSLPGAGDAQGTRPSIRVRLQFSPARNLDPVYRTRAADYFVYYNIFSHLVRWKPGTAELEPDLAERWEVSPDGRVWTFHLRKGVQFHKGFGEVAAEDVKFTFDRFTDKDVASPNASSWEGVERIEVVDRYTVRFRLKQPNLAFVANPIAGRESMIVSKRAVQQRGRNFARDPIGSGPFVFSRWTAADEVVVTANDQYFRGRPQVAAITFVPILEEAVAVAALERGDVHVIWTRGSPDAIEVIRRNRALTIDVARRPSSVRTLAFNPDVDLFRDVRVRQALAHAVNKRELEAASGGTLTPTDHLLVDTPWMRKAAAERRFPIYRYDPSRAKRLLQEAGQPRLRFVLTFPLRSPDPLIAQILAEQFRRVGVEVELNGVEQAAWNTRLIRTGQFQVTVRGIARGLDPDELARDQFHSSAVPPGDNIARYNRADALIDAAARERDPAKRQELYITLMRQVLADLPYLPLANDTLVAAWRAPVRTMVTGIDNDFPGFTIQVVRP